MREPGAARRELEGRRFSFLAAARFLYLVLTRNGRVSSGGPRPESQGRRVGVHNDFTLVAFSNRLLARIVVVGDVQPAEHHGTVYDAPHADRNEPHHERGRLGLNKFAQGVGQSRKHDARKNSSGWGALAQQKDQSFRYVIDNVFSYNNEWNKLIYSVMLGHSFEKYTYEQFGAKSDNYANGAYPSSSFDLINAGPNIYAGDISYTSYALESYFGRIALNWDNKYILNASLRSDGSSRFAKNKRYGYFPSASFAWRASNEGFFPKNKNVNHPKLR